LQVATSPCCQRDLPDVISANPSSDAWSPTTTGPTECAYLFLPPCHRPSPTEVWVSFPASTREHAFPRSVFSRLQTFLYVQASEFAHLPERSYPCRYCRRGRVEETRCTVDFPWLYPPFPASCPFRSIMAHRGLPPHRTTPCRFPAAGSSSGFTTSPQGSSPGSGQIVGRVLGT
jgi:hypothetical protein